MNRLQFLENQWTPYPAFPENADVAGRIQVISGNRIEIQDKGIWTISQSCQFPLSVLQTHDVVALGLQNGEVQELTLLAPALASPLKSVSDPRTQNQWFDFLQKVREFFKGKTFLEAQTPTLVSCPGTEPFLDLFSTTFERGRQRQKFYLPTSPELHLKKMLSMGYERIFEIRPCFRNGEISERHQPEFWMLEWYRAYSNLEQILQDTLHLIVFLGGEVEGYQRKTMADLFREKLDFQLRPGTSIEELKNLSQRLGLRAEEFSLWDDVFYLIFVEKIEPFLDSDKPLIVEKYPPSQAALARLTEDGWGERFELYWKGFEICNAFHELNDPDVQILRFQADLEQKKSLGKEAPPLDEDFLQALQSGMPPSGGIALGLERLFMALHSIHEISALKVFPHRG
ncbi:MAG: EF-P lysine aminoacylase EpmA [Pseudobdellovibrionaceae bacterium]